MLSNGLEIVDSQSGNWEMNEAEVIASAQINKYPDLKAILCANDSMAVGAVAALHGAGKTDDVYVVGFDNIAAVQRLLKEGKVLCTVDQHGDQLAVYGIEHALAMLSGQAVVGDKETPVDLVTAGLL